nr:uncharacterized protein LOC123756198 [Procambarus clarkii]
MVEQERRGSVTQLLLECVQLYAPPSPNHYPPPDPDCWDDARRPPRQDKSKQLPIISRPRNYDQREHTQMIRKDARIERAVNKHEAATLLPPEPLSNTDNVNNTDGDMTKVAVAPGGPAGRGTTSGQKPKGVMSGCSGAYQQAVLEVRGPMPDESVVMLGLPGDEPVILHHHHHHQDHQTINTCSFRVAMAASKMKSVGLRVTRHQVVSSGGRDDASDTTSLSRSMVGGRRHDRPRTGKKVFEDAYVMTWSQPILTADGSDFSITFNKPKKVRVVRVGKVRRRSLAAEVLPPQEDLEPAREEAEWLAWRRVHDRVEEWLRDNTRADPDESHVVAMLLETDSKKAALLSS